MDKESEISAPPSIDIYRPILSADNMTIKFCSAMTENPLRRRQELGLIPIDTSSLSVWCEQESVREYIQPS